MRMIFVAAALALLPLSARAAEWQPLPPEEYAFQAVNLADMSLTLDIKNHRDMQEANPMLGQHPSDAAVFGYKLGAGALHAVVTELLLQHGASKRVMRIWEWTSIGVEGAAVGNNLSLGLHCQF
jgi:hypothetical protein